MPLRMFLGIVIITDRNGEQDQTLVSMGVKTSAILLSRQPLRPSGQTSWVKRSMKAVRWLKRRRLVLCSSIGMQTWELLTSLASLERIKLTLFVPATDTEEFKGITKFAVEQFDLDLGLVKFVPMFSDKKNASKEQLWLKRDEMVVEAADLLIPVSLRKGGHMDLAVQMFADRGKSVEERFRADYKSRREPLAYRIEAEQLNSELALIGNRYLIHWTRASNSAWPTERLIDYYQAIIESNDYPRSAFRTLMNILTMRKIVATPKNMPLGIPTVSFSGLPPTDVVPLIRWRSRFQQMSFEPYGIGIEKEYAVSRGTYPVRYYARNCKRTIANEPWLWQSVGGKSDWRAEQEYRCKGDFGFSDTPSHRLLAFCHTQSEAEIIEESTGIRAVSFLGRYKFLLQ